MISIPFGDGCRRRTTRPDDLTCGQTPITPNSAFRRGLPEQDAAL